MQEGGSRVKKPVAYALLVHLLRTVATGLRVAALATNKPNGIRQHISDTGHTYTSACSIAHSGAITFVYPHACAQSHTQPYTQSYTYAHTIPLAISVS